MNNVTVTAVKWRGGWELWQDGEVITQVRHLVNAQQQVRDYWDTMDPETDHSDLMVSVVASDDLRADIDAAREATSRAAQAQEEAARQSRETVRSLLGAGISATDASILMGVTKSRVSQLANS